MKVAIWVDAVASLKAGGNHAGAYALEVDGGALTAEERETLATKCTSSASRRELEKVAADLYLCYGPGPTSLRAATLDDLRRVLAESAAEVAASRAKREADAKAEAEREAEKRAARDAELSAAPVRELVCGKGETWDRFRPVYEATAEGYPLTGARRAEVEAECARLNAEADAKREAAAKREADAKAAETAAVEAAKAALAEWAAAHGSERVRERMAGGYSCWVGGAIDERGALVADAVAGELDRAEVPGEDIETDTEPRKCPTLAELRALKAARERAAQVAGGDTATVELVRVTYTPSDDEEYHATELEVTVTVLGQWERVHYYATPAE